MSILNLINEKAPWFNSENIRPYVFVRPENKIENPGTLHKLNWFTKEPIYKNPLDLKELPFAEAIYQIECRDLLRDLQRERNLCQKKF